MLFHCALQAKGTVSDTNIHRGSKEELSHHRKIKLELFKSQKLLLLPKASRIRGGLPSTRIHADAELSVCPFSGSSRATRLLPEPHLFYSSLHSSSTLTAEAGWRSEESPSAHPNPQCPQELWPYRETKKAPSKQAQVSYTVREEVF